MRNFIGVFLLFLVFTGCKDDALEEAQEKNFFTATIDSVNWAATQTYSQRVRGENGPLTITGEGDGYTLELILGGITEPGVYPMGTNRTGRIKYGNNTYYTLDVKDAGEIVITNFSENRVEGEFNFKAQWLSAGNQLQVTNGKFSAFFY